MDDTEELEEDEGFLEGEDDEDEGFTGEELPRTEGK